MSDYSKSRFFGIYLGTVEFNLDPLQRGRVKVRIINSDDFDTNIADLNWAEVINSGGVGWDYGNINIPEVGTTVYVSFLNGDPDKPVVLGGYFKHLANDKTYVDYTENEQTSLRKYIYSDYTDEFNSTSLKRIETPHNINEYPIESQTLLNNQPTKKITKTVKGHSIIIEDRDGAESLEIIDRAGQILKFKANVLPASNSYNANKRGIKRSDAKNSLNKINIFEDSSTEILLKDIKGQGFNIKSKEQLESIEINSNNDKHKKQSIKFEPGLNNFNINVTNDKSISNIDINGETGEITIYSDNNINLISNNDIILSAKNIISNGDNFEKDETFINGVD